MARILRLHFNYPHCQENVLAFHGELDGVRQEVQQYLLVAIFVTLQLGEEAKGFLRRQVCLAQILILVGFVFVVRPKGHHFFDLQATGMLAENADRRL